MIRDCYVADFETILAIINDGAQAYRGVILEDRLHEPNMAADELHREIADGVVFSGAGILAAAVRLNETMPFAVLSHFTVPVVISFKDVLAAGSPLLTLLFGDGRLVWRRSRLAKFANSKPAPKSTAAKQD